MRILHVIAGLPQAAGTSVFCMEVCHALSQETLGGIIHNADKTDARHLPSENVICVIAVCNSDCLDIYQPEGQPSGTIPIVSIKEGLQEISSFDLVHLHALWHPALHQVVRYAKRHQIPYVFSPHGMLTPWALGQKRLKKWMALALYQYWDLRGAVLIHVTAESELADVRRLGLKQPVVVAPLGAKVPTEAPALRHNNPRIALFVSRLHPKKGLFNLVDAWAKVKKHSAVENWKFIVAGPDQDGHAAEVMERAKAADVEEDLEMIGPVFGKQKDYLYVKADLFVLPSYSENFGVVVIEALSHGCPVITTKETPWAELENCGDALMRKCVNEGEEGGVAGLQGVRKMPREGSSTYPAKLATPANPAIAANGRCGWWVDIGVEPLAQALREAMCLTDEERRAMGENGRRLVERRYTWSAIANQMRSTYEWLLTGGEKPDCVRVL